eukprot:TRINITY_DN6291_c0_g1_i1.p1 TRINITY_DN6291_c0_g1~~TRINITY_DN6291_c0_g1_i1.p1  ORF type:complete len:108 (-),score=6.96 TRINITY_DN6291_c0_g1_i1:112-435(-)
MSDGRMITEHKFREAFVPLDTQPSFRTSFHLPNNQQIRLMVAKDAGELHRPSAINSAPKDTPPPEEPFRRVFPKISSSQNLGDRAHYFNVSIRELSLIHISEPTRPY